MRKILMLSLVLFLPFSAQAQESPVQPLSYDEYYDFASKIKIEDHQVDQDRFLELMAGDDVAVLDLRKKERYDQEHIKGAVHAGSDLTEKDMERLVPSKETTVLLYCDNSLYPMRKMSLTHMVLPQVVKYGYKNVFMLDAEFGEDFELGTVKKIDKIPMVHGNDARDE